MSKYYTPTIEEFHVGFEYEDRLDDHNFISQIFGEDRDETYIIEEHIDDNKIRVKYLNQEDIESLGWKSVEDSQAKELGIPQIFYVYHSKNKNKIYKLRHSHPNHLVITATQFNIFEGRIKNKSELKKLMQQLGINE